jgi:hypothetical protein
MDFEEALTSLGFRVSEERRLGGGAGLLYTATPNRYMTYMVHVYPDGTALFTWEFAIADYLATLGLQVGSDEALNQFLYPRGDLRGPQEGAWLADAMDATEQALGAVHLASPDGSSGD